MILTLQERFRISDLQAGHLDNRCVTIVAKISRCLARQGIILKLQDEDVLKKVDLYARNSSDKELSILHAQLKVALKSYIKSEQFKAKRSLILYQYRHQHLPENQPK